MKTALLNKRKVTTNIFLRTVLIAKTAYLALGIAIGRVLLFAENEVALNLFASMFAISTVVCLVLLIRSANHFLGYKLYENESQTERWYSKPKALAEELLFPKHMIKFVKQGCTKTEVLRFFQPYDCDIYDENKHIVKSKLELLYYTYNRSILLFLTGIDYPYYKFN